VPPSASAETGAAGEAMPKGQQGTGANNKPKLSNKEKAEKKKAKKEQKANK
jgi:hypothetical protein